MHPDRVSQQLAFPLRLTGGVKVSIDTKKALTLALSWHYNAEQERLTTCYYM